ncbi:hypothetical protein CROQUDRAFT_444253 [Cronartium quercuum f. sp. fusiforme G11]|uniref:Uncharacterized protein n=1 Tax=Cronartium quercuum f. sp. fusiforme G11 TaxID=708437 RepID=A0A9P6NKW3_9BASI|nr:hypothetical protein CROQUDRAFT_444253 [Cronartium quercuum f. sp. fusiforme G11]
MYWKSPKPLAVSVAQCPSDALASSCSLIDDHTGTTLVYCCPGMGLQPTAPCNPELESTCPSWSGSKSKPSRIGHGEMMRSSVWVKAQVPRLLNKRKLFRIELGELNCINT